MMTGGLVLAADTTEAEPVQAVAAATQTKAKTAQAAPVQQTYSLDLDTTKYEKKTMTVDGKKVAFRAYENRVYVAHPVDTTYQSMNIYVPEGYFNGKEISGTGMDPNITGRTERFSQEPAFRALAPDIERIVILDITEASHGNGAGCGMADIVSYRFVNKMDFASVYTNCITAKSFRMALLPLYGNSDKDAIEMAMAHAFLTDPNQAKIVRIKNTLKLEDIECSVSCLEDIKNDPDMTITSEPFTWKFNEEDNLW